MTMTATDPKEKFRQVYADVFIDDDIAAFERAMSIRQLDWRGERQPLAAVADQYAEIDSYNNFEGGMIHALQNAFPDAGIEATPARELSVAIYLHIPDEHRDAVEKFVTENFNADNLNWHADGLRVWWD